MPEAKKNQLALKNYLPDFMSQSPFVDILIVDDNSPDNTADEVRFLQKKFKNILTVGVAFSFQKHQLAHRNSFDIHYYLIFLSL